MGRAPGAGESGMGTAASMMSPRAAPSTRRRPSISGSAVTGTVEKSTGPAASPAMNRPIPAERSTVMASFPLSATAESHASQTSQDGATG